MLVAVAIIAATCGFIASAVVRRNKRRARVLFALGFFCGFTTSKIVRGRHRRLNALRAVARRLDVSRRKTGIRSHTAGYVRFAPLDIARIGAVTASRSLRRARPDPVRR